jgi:hypothetical protein
MTSGFPVEMVVVVVVIVVVVVVTRILWWTLWYSDRLFSEYVGFPLSVSLHQCYIHIRSPITSAIKPQQLRVVK